MVLHRLHSSRNQWQNKENYAIIFNECLQSQIRKESLSDWGRQYKAIDVRKNMTVTQNVLLALCNKRHTKQTKANSGIIVK